MGMVPLSPRNVHTLGETAFLLHGMTDEIPVDMERMTGDISLPFCQKLSTRPIRICMAMRGSAKGSRLTGI